MTALDMQGFSVSLLPFSEHHSSWVNLFDAPCFSCAWPRTSPLPPSTLPPPPPTRDVVAVPLPLPRADRWSGTEIMLRVCERMVAEGKCISFACSALAAAANVVCTVFSIIITATTTTINMAAPPPPSTTWQAPSSLKWTPLLPTVIWVTRYLQPPPHNCFLLIIPHSTCIVPRSTPLCLSRAGCPCLPGSDVHRPFSTALALRRLQGYRCSIP